MINRLTFSSFILVTFFGCSSYNDIKHEPSFIGEIKDNAEWYKDADGVVTEIRVHIPKTNDFLCAPYDNHEGAQRPCTLEDIDGDSDARDDYAPILHVHVEADGFISSNELMNATMKQKGKSTRGSSEKSYRIKLDSKEVLIFNERTLQLNKSPYDKSRIRNKMAFDFFREVPNITSSKTRFVNLKIDGVDRGFFTHVEKTDGYFLEARGFSQEDNVYKTQNFAFFYPDERIKLDDTGKPENLELFETALELDSGEDYYKLIEMVKAINSAKTDAKFSEVFEQYFNRKNYITWLALNIIMANKDTVSQNFYLFNPKYTDKFYFMPWDYDGTGRPDDEYTKVEYGLGNWWGIPLHKGFIKIKANRDELDKMVDNIRQNYITPEKIKEKITMYKKLMDPYVIKSPDVDFVNETRWNDAMNNLVLQLDRDIKNYKDEIGSPMPFWQSVKYDNGDLILEWEKSIDLEGDPIVYDISFADNVDLNNSIVYERGLDSSSSKLQEVNGWMQYKTQVPLTSGKSYYMYVISKEKDNNESYQIAFNKAVRVGKLKYPGLLEFIVE